MNEEHIIHCMTNQRLYSEGSPLGRRICKPGVSIEHPRCNEHAQEFTVKPGELNQETRDENTKQATRPAAKFRRNKFTSESLIRLHYISNLVVP